MISHSWIAIAICIHCYDFVLIRFINRFTKDLIPIGRLVVGVIVLCAGVPPVLIALDSVYSVALGSSNQVLCNLGNYSSHVWQGMKMAWMAWAQSFARIVAPSAAMFLFASGTNILQNAQLLSLLVGLWLSWSTLAPYAKHIEMTKDAEQKASTAGDKQKES